MQDRVVILAGKKIESTLPGALASARGPAAARGGVAWGRFALLRVILRTPRPRTQMDLAAECGVSQVTIAFSVDPIVLEVGVLLTDGTPLDFVVRVPPVELALIFKAYAAQSRHAPKEVTDLYNLLLIAFEYPVDEIGGWKIGTAPISGTRLDAARILHTLAALIRALVARPIPGAQRRSRPTR